MKQQEKVHLLKLMEVDVYQLRGNKAKSKEKADRDDKLIELAKEIAVCRRCQLCETRTQTVFGVGNKNAKVMFIGEAPGADEDLQGEPFVGRAGQLLNRMLSAIGWDRESIYIANMIKCRPPNNRNPSQDEIKQCADYFSRQIEIVNPKLIVAMGRIAAHSLLNSSATISSLRGKVHQLEQLSPALIVTYHPAYLLRSPSEKTKSWQDLLFIRKTLNDLG